MEHDSEIADLQVQLSFTTLKEGTPGVVLASKIRKKKRKLGGKKVSAPKLHKLHHNKTPVHKRRRKRNKKKRVESLRVSTCVTEVLEDPSDLDAQYLALKAKVLKKLQSQVEITQCSKEETLEHKISQILSTNDRNTFYLVDLTTIILKFKDWIEYLPRIRPFYAVKCNPDPQIIGTLVACGTGLDVASMPEMQKGIAAGCEPDLMIFANPCKMIEHIQFARANGVKKMTFDNADELKKIHSVYPEAELVLRILADDSHSTMRFGSKFGANVSTEVEPLLKLAYQLGLNVIGVSFHVGSGCQSGVAYRNSLMLARRVFDMAESMGHPMSLLDIGGGFLGSDTATVVFADIAQSIAASLDELFPENVRVIAEPGRYFASECMVLVTTVIARRERTIPSLSDGEESETYVDYYISDGVYGSFNNLFFDYAQPSPVPMNRRLHQSADSISVPPSPGSVEFSEAHHRSTLFGPTCDSIDVVCKNVDLPELEIGDHIYFFNMGAYTAAAASSFNGFVPPVPHYIIS